jgi:hypothetical protein
MLFTIWRLGRAKEIKRGITVNAACHRFASTDIEGQVDRKLEKTA